MIDDMKVVCCDQADCSAMVSGPGRRLRALAEEEGWQVEAPVYAEVSEDDFYVQRTDRCPAHPATVIDPSDPAQVHRSMWG